MKTYKNSYYQVTDKRNNGHFVEQHNTLKEAHEAMERSKQKQIELGYTPSENVIVYVEWERTFDEEGNFVAEKISKHTVKNAE